jgi:REP element-mobilizing transposase RayT
MGIEILYLISLMANTYTQIHIQLVFAVQNRASLIKDSWKNEMYKYMTGIIQNKDHKMLQINSMPDHIHILIGLRPTQALAELVKVVKQESTSWINDQKFTLKKFNWQEGYGAFSYTKSDVPRVIKYIQNQENHHREIKFLDEYVEMLKVHEIDYDEKYLFKPIE